MVTWTMNFYKFFRANKEKWIFFNIEYSHESIDT